MLQKMVDQPRAGNEKSLLAKASVNETETETETGTETRKEIKGIKTVTAIAIVWTRSAIKTVILIGSVIENGTEERIMTKRVGALDIIDMRTMTGTDDILLEIMGGEIGIGTRKSIKTRIEKGISPQDMDIIEIWTKMTESGIKMAEKTAKSDTAPGIGLMMRLRRNVMRERGVPHYTGRKGLGRNATCMRIACKMIEPKKSVVLFCLLQVLNVLFQRPRYDREDSMETDSKTAATVRAETPEEGEI